MSKRLHFALCAVLLIAVSCRSIPDTLGPEKESVLPMQPGMGMGPGMMSRHHAEIPAEYSAIENPAETDFTSLERGQALYEQHCAACHGETGMGEGPAGAALDPPPSAIAHTSQMLGDDYLFWRISEGGVSFQTAMPAWKAILSKSERWDVIDYIREIGREGETAIATIQADRQRTMLDQAVGMGIIDVTQAETFARVHEALETYLKEHSEETGNMDEREGTALRALETQGTITESDRLIFENVHDLLVENGLMP